MERVDTGAAALCAQKKMRRMRYIPRVLPDLQRYARGSMRRRKRRRPAMFVPIALVLDLSIEPDDHEQQVAELLVVNAFAEIRTVNRRPLEMQLTIIAGIFGFGETSLYRICRHIERSTGAILAPFSRPKELKVPQCQANSSTFYLD